MPKILHKQSHTKTWKSWYDAKRRCQNPKAAYYSHYGGRGITVCERWQTFENFLDDMGECPDGFSLERKNVDVGYKPDNCIWVPRNRQSSNQRTNRKLTLNGKTQNISDWARELDMKRETIKNRLNLGWSDKKTLTTPVRKSG